MSASESRANGEERGAPLLLTLLLGLFVLVGVLVAFAVALDWLRGLATYSWRPAVCEILESAAVYRPAVGDHCFTVRYRYRARGAARTGDTYRHGYSGSETEAKARVLASRYPVGLEVPCWVDPDDPAQSALRRADLWNGLWIFVPLVFIATGAGGLWLVRHPDPWKRLAAAAPRAAGGNRGSLAGAGCLAAFFGLFLAVGLLILVPFFLWPLYRIVDARSWKETPCEILSADVRAHPGDDGTTYSVEVLYRYRVGDREYLSDRYHFLSGSTSGYQGKADAVAALEPGTRTICFVDPRDPQQAVLQRGLGSELLFGLIPLLFVVVGAGGAGTAIWAARSARRAAERPSWPAAPSRERRQTAEGPIQLEPATGPFGKLAAAAVVTLIWHGILAPFLWQVIESWRSGDPDWILALLLTPFVLVGLLLLTSVPYALLALVNPRPRLRLSRARLRPGESAQVEWSFRGAAGRLERLTLRLAAYRARAAGERSPGTSTRPLATVEVVERRRGFGLEYGAATLTIPSELPDEPGEGDGGGGRRIWKLELHGEIAYWPDVREEFEIEVLEPEMPEAESSRAETLD